MSLIEPKHSMPGRPDKPAESYPLNPVPVGAVVLVMVMSMVAAVLGHWRWASALMAAALLLGAALRLILPRSVAGLLVIRRRWIDVTVMAALGVSTLVMAMIVPPL